MPPFWLAAVLGPLLLGGCRSDHALPSAPTSPTTSPGGGASANACAARASVGNGPITDPSGPFFHQVALAATSDEGRTIADARQILDHASVPDGTRLPDGTVGVYYVNGAEGGVWLARVTGGDATPVGPISIDGVARPQGVVDPDATLLPNGRVRLVYLGGFGTAGASQVRAFCVAESTDGLQFQTVATAVDLGSSTSDTDPSVTRVRDGSWLMASSRGQQTVLARSADGLSFTIGETLSVGGVPEVATLADGRVRLWVCAGGIESYVSTDSGRSWSREGVVVPTRALGHAIICDPSRVDGTNLFVFKTAN